MAIRRPSTEEIAARGFFETTADDLSAAAKVAGVNTTSVFVLGVQRIDAGYFHQMRSRQWSPRPCVSSMSRVKKAIPYPVASTVVGTAPSGALPGQHAGW